MSKPFFTSWQLWEKMVFVLAASIVTVIILGCIKLAYNHWRLRKYTAIAATKAAVRQEMQHSQSVKRGRAKAIPFGVRALESGIEVDGVWISGTNTPFQSMPGSPNLTPQRGSTQTDSSDHRLLGPAQPRVDGSQPFNPSDRPVLPRREYDRPPTPEYPLSSRATYQPRRSSHLRFSNSLSPEDSAALTSLEGHEPASDRNGKSSEGPNREIDGQQTFDSGSSSSSGDGKGAFRQVGHSSRSSRDFLHPNYQKPSKDREHKGFELKDIGPSAGNRQSHPDVEGHVQAQKQSNEPAESYPRLEIPVANEPVSPACSSNDPFQTPVDISSDDHITVFDLDADSSYQHTQLADENDVAYDIGHAQPLPTFDGNRELRKSQVLRKVNSGFEILRSGTLVNPPQISDGNPWSEDGAKNRRRPKKLQRKDRTNSYSIEQP